MDTKEGSGAHREGEESGRIMDANAGAMTVAREYRRGNWTLPETMVLIEAKKRVHSERQPAELGLARWRWVEDYCWRAGCRRSQNQCNDRWDNLMRDYKKVRAYGEQAGAEASPSYWEMARAERKARYLPSNLLREIYEAMGEIVERRTGFGGGPFLGAPPPQPLQMVSTGLVGVPVQASPLAQIQPRPLALEDQEGTRCSSGSPERKRLRLSLDGQPGSSTPASAAGHNDRHQEPQGDDDMESSDDDVEEQEELSGAIGQCAAILSGALESREAAEERRHREVMAVEERRSAARQARREAGEQCMAGLAAAVGQLAGSMLALAAKHEGPAAPK